MAAVLYVANKITQLVWGMLPMSTVDIKVLPDNVVRITFPKHLLADKLGMYGVGQYAFVNFPRLSLFAWHPFTLASGPRETNSCIYVKGLGDYTKALVQRAGRANRLWIRVDGPYGGARVGRYPVLVFVAGGIGATPILSILKDIYDVGVPAARRMSSLPPMQETQFWQQAFDLESGHMYYYDVQDATNTQYEPPAGWLDQQRFANRDRHIRDVYVLWTIRSPDQLQWFEEELVEMVERATDPGFPRLHLTINITGKEANLAAIGSPALTALCRVGRPDVAGELAAVAKDHRKVAIKLFCCGPAPLVQTALDEAAAINRTCPASAPLFYPHAEKFEF